MLDFVNKCEKDVQKEFEKINEIVEFNSFKVLDAFIKNRVTEAHFNSSTGYGYNDIGREVIESIYSDIFKTEDALVRTQFISGTHALSTTLFGLLRPNDTMLSITGPLYDTLQEVIYKSDSSLKSFDINYEEIDLIDNDFDYKKIKEILENKKIKLVEIQRSKGYSTRKSISIDKIEKVIEEIRKIDSEVIIMIDNCYCEFVTKKEPSEVGADIVVGSLIKNLGAGITPNGAYVVGKSNLVKLVSERLNVPGQGKEVGPSLGANKQILQGLFYAPSVVASALKTAILASKVFSDLGYKVEPNYNEERVDIVQNIEFNEENELIKFCQGIQSSSPIDSSANITPWDMPGYDNKVIMASGSFISGSSIELSCDAPIRKPYIAYMQGSLTYEYGKYAIINTAKKIKQ